MDRRDRDGVDASVRQPGLRPRAPVVADEYALVRGGRDGGEAETECSNGPAVEPTWPRPAAPPIPAQQRPGASRAGQDQPGLERAERDRGGDGLTTVHGRPGRAAVAASEHGAF